MKQNRKIIFGITTALLIAYLFFRLCDMSTIITSFPLQTQGNDYSSHIAKLFFLSKYDLHENVPYWYNGNYPLLKYYSPGWYIFTLPLFYMIGQPQAAAYVSLIIIYFLAAGIVLWSGKWVHLSLIERIGFFSFFYANPLTIGYFLALGKLPEFFSWAFFILLFFFIIYYKDKTLDKKFFFIIPIFTLLFYAHILAAVCASFLLLCLFLVKSNKERFKLILAGLCILLLTSFFWLPFYQDKENIGQAEFRPLRWIANFSDNYNMIDVIMAFITPFIFLVLLGIYFKTNKFTKKDILFYTPLIIFAILYFTRIVIFIPVINQIHPDTFHIFFILLAVYLLFKIDTTKLNTSIRKLWYSGIIIIPIIGIILSSIITPFYPDHTPLMKDTITVLNKVNGNIMITPTPEGEILEGALYSYAAVYLNLSTPSGWDPANVDREYYKKMKAFPEAIYKQDCDLLQKNIMTFGVGNIITFDNHCTTLATCRYNLSSQQNRVCLYDVRQKN